MTPTADNTIIDVRNVTKQFGPVKAVDDVNLKIGRGEFFSLLGPSGCGKTTLLRMLAGFEYPSAGEIVIDGEDMSDVPPNLRPTKMVFQSYAIFPHLNVGQNIAYGLRKLRLTAEEQRRRVDEMLDMIKLQGFAERRSDQLSGGQRQRIALARALICEPSVLLLDEPLGALDKKLREEMQIELRQLQERLKITFVFVTHDQEEALALSDRIAVMFKGQVLQVADPHRLYERPSSPEVAAFIGSMNFASGEVKGREGDRVVIEAKGLGILKARPPEGFSATAGSPVTIAIRPEKLTLSSGRSGNGAGVEGRIAATAYLGDRSHYFVKVEGLDRLIAVAAQNVDSSIEGWLSAGEPVRVTWREDGIVVLAGR